MKAFLLAVEIFSALASIACILLHSAKGEGLGALGGQSSMFNTQKDLEKNLSKATTFFVICFFISAILLSIIH